MSQERAIPAGDPPDDPLESDERRRPVAAVHHHVFDMTFAVDVAGERLVDARARHLREVLAFAVRLLVPALDAEPGVHGLLHAAAPQAGIIPSTPRVRGSTAALDAAGSWSCETACSGASIMLARGATMATLTVRNVST